MDRLTVHMDRQEWNQLLFVLAHAEGKGITWQVVNPLVMTIGEQLNAQSPQAAPPPNPGIESAARGGNGGGPQ